MDKETLFALMLSVDPMTKRVPEGLLLIAMAIEAKERERCGDACKSLADEEMREAKLQPVGSAARDRYVARYVALCSAATELQLGPNAANDRPCPARAGSNEAHRPPAGQGPVDWLVSRPVP